MASNDLIERYMHKLVEIRDAIRAIQGSKCFLVFDLKDAFYNIEIEENDRHETAFEFEGTMYE
ncbi:hypothetical protein PAEPH01_2943 [Pancytospora epiphaga]|nr:hypothetical protein PAEPH01_2943 [Pancytospora epiphaga]